jgi:hypothetical protein
MRQKQREKKKRKKKKKRLQFRIFMEKKLAHMIFEMKLKLSISTIKWRRHICDNHTSQNIILLSKKIFVIWEAETKFLFSFLGWWIEGILRQKKKKRKEKIDS